MIKNMDWLATFPLIVGAVGNLSAAALDAVAQRLLTIALAALLVGGVTLFAVTAFAWLWVRRTVAELHPPPASTARP